MGSFHKRLQIANQMKTVCGFNYARIIARSASSGGGSGQKVSFWVKVLVKITVWKFFNFSITKILREIYISRSAQSVVSTQKALNYDLYEFLQILKAKIYQFNNCQSS